MIERFNGRISEGVKQTRFESAKQLQEALNHYKQIYNNHIPQRALGHIPPVRALKKWQETHPHLFKKAVYNHTGLDTSRFPWHCCQCDSRRAG